MPGAVADLADARASTRPGTGSPASATSTAAPGRDATSGTATAAASGGPSCTRRCTTPSVMAGVKVESRPVERSRTATTTCWSTASRAATSSPPTACTRRSAGCSASSCRPAAPPVRAAQPRRAWRRGRPTSRCTGPAASEAYVTPVGERPGRRGGAQPTGPAVPDAARRAPAAGRAAGRRALAAGARRRPAAAAVAAGVAGRVLLVGDAAGYVDALTGEGIALGLAQARAAVDAVDPAGPWRTTRRRRPGSGRRHDLLTKALLGSSRIAAGAPARSCRRRPGCRGVFGAAVNQLARPA